MAGGKIRDSFLKSPKLQGLPEQIQVILYRLGETSTPTEFPKFSTRDLLTLFRRRRYISRGTANSSANFKSRAVIKSVYVTFSSVVQHSFGGLIHARDRHWKLTCIGITETSTVSVQNRVILHRKTSEPVATHGRSTAFDNRPFIYIHDRTSDYKYLIDTGVDISVLLYSKRINRKPILRR